MKDNKISCYGIYLSHFYLLEDVALKEMKNIYQLLKRIIASRECFNNISILLGVSNTNSNTSSVTYIKTNKRGRPKRKVIGEKFGDFHLHIYVFNHGKTPSYFCRIACDRLRKKYPKIIYSKHNNPNIAIDYVEKQRNNKLSFGPLFHSQK